MLKQGIFELQSEEEIVIEQKKFIENLESMDSYYMNEHIVNLLMEVRGNLQDCKERMLNQIDMYLNMSEEDKVNFAVGRRLNYYFTLSDLNNVKKKKTVAEYISNIKEKKYRYGL